MYTSFEMYMVITFAHKYFIPHQGSIPQDQRTKETSSKASVCKRV